MHTNIQKTGVALALLALLSTLNSQLSTALAQGTAFTYQGRLDDNGVPANGSYDLRFILYDADPGGSQQGPILTNAATAVANGLFLVTLDFETNFPGADRFLEIAVRTNGGGAFAILTPRQKLAPAPYAIFAGAAGNLSGPFSGDVSGTQGATMIASVGGVTAVNVASGANAANAATNNSTPDTIVKRDDAGGITASNLTLNGNLFLPSGTTNSGVIFSGSNTLVVNFGDGNFFAGARAGNLAMTGAAGFSRNTALGDGTLATDLTGYLNTAVGFDALSNNFNGVYNTAVGALALQFNTSGSQNTAFGVQALESNTVSINNTAVGYQSLYSTVNSANNTAVGFQSLANNTGGYENTTVGSESLQFNGNGALNTAVGFTALYLNTSGSGNVAVGVGAMTHNLSGASNVGIGQSALFNNSSGFFNVGVGNNALYGNSTGNYNTVAGANAMQTVSTASANTVMGYQALYNGVGDGNIAIGFQAGYNVLTNGNNIEIGNMGLAGDGNVIRLGTPGTHTNTFIAGIIYGNGGGLTNLNGGDAATLNGLGATNFWQLGGNDVAGGQFIGSTNNQPLEFWVNGQRALRLEPTSDAPNVIGGLRFNYVSNGVFGATIAGGGNANYFGTALSNSVSGDFGTVVGGAGNSASGMATTIGGGESNHAGGDYSTVSGGSLNQASGIGSTIGGGGFSIASGDSSTVGGGGQNGASGPYATVSGGQSNGANGDHALVGGGYGNDSSGDYSTIGGGNDNIASNLLATVGGGGNNVAGDWYSTVAGGEQNQATALASAIGGGRFNYATADYATVPGGYNNVAGGEYSFAAGNGARAANNGSFVWSDNSGAGVITEYDNQFYVRASGGVAFFTAASNVGAQLAPGSGSWSSFSDRNAKENFQSVNAQSVLEQVAAMPLTTWNYKAQDKSIRHIGPMAQDFAAAFKVGENDTTISTVDEGGVALAAIQGLNQKLEEQVKEKDAEIQDLKQRLETLEKIVLNPKSN